MKKNCNCDDVYFSLHAADRMRIRIRKTAAGLKKAKMILGIQKRSHQL